MSTTIDTRGLSCPQPVLMFMDAVKSGNENEIIVFTDTDASKENVSRAAENKKYTIKDIEQQGDEYKITLIKD
ncbi:MAG: sulfurtransferase TusA family protein [Desulfobacterales bacterium]|nr:sulfurtransferase TusA family protein [Desulfobacterales bacterium]